MTIYTFSQGTYIFLLIPYFPGARMFPDFLVFQIFTFDTFHIQFVLLADLQISFLILKQAWGRWDGVAEVLAG